MIRYAIAPMFALCLIFVACEGEKKEETAEKATAASTPADAASAAKPKDETPEKEKKKDDGPRDAFTITASGPIAGEGPRAIAVFQCVGQQAAVTWKSSKTLNKDAPYQTTSRLSVNTGTQPGTYDNTQDASGIDFSLTLDTEKVNYSRGPEWSVTLTESGPETYAGTFTTQVFPVGENYMPDTTQPPAEITGSFRHTAKKPCGAP